MKSLHFLQREKKVYDSLMWSQGISDTFKIPKAHISLFANLFQKVTKNCFIANWLCLVALLQYLDHFLSEKLFLLNLTTTCT